MKTKKAINQRIPLCFLLIMTLIPGWVHARGDGVRVGQSGSFHPRLYLDTGYDNNVFNRSSQNPATLLPVDTAYLNVRPGLQLEIPSHPIGFELSGYANYSLFFNSTAANLNTITAKADLTVTLFRNSPVSFSLTNNFSRSSGDENTANDVFERVAFYHQLGTTFRQPFISHDNKTAALLTIQPGGREGPFKFDIGYTFRFAINPDPDTDNNRHKLRLGTKWAFFPKTALLFEASGEFVNFNPRFDFSQTSTVTRSSVPVKGTVGIVGNFTENLSLTVRVGGGYNIIDTSVASTLPDDTYGMAIGSAILTYYFSPTIYFRMGLSHDFHPSAFSNFMHQSAGFLEFTAQINRFLIGLRGSAAYIGFGKVNQTVSQPNNGGVTTRFNSNNINADGTINRNDIIVRGNATFDFNITQWFVIGLRAGVDWRNSDLFVITSEGQIGLSYLNFKAALKLEVAY